MSLIEAQEELVHARAAFVRARAAECDARAAWAAQRALLVADRVERRRNGQPPTPRVRLVSEDMRERVRLALVWQTETTTTEVLGRMGLESTRAGQMLVAAVLRDLGWTSARESRAGVRAVRWYAPPDTVRGAPQAAGSR